MKEYKIAVIGDIHSNYIGLERCIHHALEKNADEFLFLGDYISDCPYPQKTMKIIYEMAENYPCRFIRGNREDYMLNHRKNTEERWTYSSASGSLLYTYENLTEKDFVFFENMDTKGYYEKEGFPPFRYCHGSLTRSNEILEPEGENTKNIMAKLDTDFLVSGHVHFQEDRYYGEKRLLHPGAAGGGRPVMRWKEMILPLLLTALGSAGMFAGASRGELRILLGKAVKICLECIGIG